MSSLNDKPTGRQYWRSLDELADTEEFRDWLYREFPAGATEMVDSTERRQFLRIMGASFALAGLGLGGCRRWPKEMIVPFARRPEGRAPGLPTYYATSMEHGGVASGLLVTSFDGRPTKIEGNPEHPVNRGATDVWAQASVLELYDPERSRHIMRRDGDQRKRVTRDELHRWVRTHFDGLAGSGLAFLAEASDSPSMLDMRTRLLKRFGGASWYEYEPINHDNQNAGTEAAFGAPWRPQYRFDRAKVVVSLDADFLATDPAMVRNTRQFADGRRIGGPQGSMSRLYVLESAFTLTGANADTRLIVRSADVAPIAAHLAARLVPEVVPAKGTKTVPVTTLGIDQAAMDAMVHDLESHRGEGLVVAGPRQPAEVHVLAHLINDRLGNIGKTVSYTALPDARSNTNSITALVRAMTAGNVTTLVILGGDPVYNAPADLDLHGLLVSNTITSVHLSLYDNQTSQDCTWHVPRAQYLESWGDARAWDGTWSVVQPLIEPLMGGCSAIELLALITDDQVTAGYDIVRRTMSESARRTDFESLWRRTLHDGFLAGSAATLQARKVAPGAGATAAETIWQQWTPAGEGTFELVFVADMKVSDGRYANNGWLQELPDPMTKLTWDNAVLMGMDAAEGLRLESGDMVRITHGGREITAAVLVMPGQHPRSVTLSLGYGQALGVISDGAGFNFYLLRTTGGMGFATGASIDRVSGSYTLAVTQQHHAIDSIGGKGTQQRLPSLFREATLDEYRKNPGFANDHHHTGVHVPHRLSLWEETNLEGAQYAWAMSIDLNACTGCGACIVACQAENNIPIVGKDQVKRGREMHWLRVDRYFRGQNPAAPDAAAMQPVPCMMCENAPCEQVCPVAATTHDKDGLNVMIYNRCIGTRYCSNNCPYKVRRFNYFDYAKRRPVRESGLLHVKPDYYTRPQTDTNPLRQLQFNPEVTIRSRGVMEKCTYCVQRISAAKISAKNAWVKLSPEAKDRDRRVTVPDDSFTTACAQACPAQAIVFGDKNDPASGVTARFANERTYQMLEELNTKPRTRYQARIRNAAASLTASVPSSAEPGH